MFLKILKSLVMFSYLLGCGAYAQSIKYKIIAGKPHLNNISFVEVYGHRGDRSYSPENSIPGYLTGLKVGVDWIDIDIGITQDGVVVVYHDLWINPDFTSINGKFFAKNKQEFFASMVPNEEKQIQPYLIKNIKFAELEKYDIGILNPDSSYAKFFPQQISVPNTRIPSLQNVIDYVDGITNKSLRYQIEIKNDPLNPMWTVSPHEFATKVYNILKKNNLIERTEIQSFDWSVLYELQKLNKKIKTAYLVGYDDISRMQESDVTTAGLWSGGKLLKDYDNSLPKMVKALGGSCYEPEDVALTKKDLDEAHKLGLKVVVWTWPEHSGTTFDPQLIDKLISWGIDGIITDDPGRLNSMLAARGYRVPKNYVLD
jgi:glycerophosphoryl diester phosphodiesterase